MKQNWRPGTMIYPLPAVIVSCGSSVADSNLITVAWVGTICSDPAMCSISVRPERYSYGLIKQTMEFTVNLTTEEMARATDWIGVRSGRDYDKWKETGLTPCNGVAVRCPYVAESPISIECRVKSIVSLGTHDMFIAEVVNVLADDRFINRETGAFDLAKARPICYSHGRYYGLGEELGHFGWSVKKKKQSNKIN